MYLEPWHADIFEFLDLKKNTGKEEQRARDLFYGLWVLIYLTLPDSRFIYEKSGRKWRLDTL